jgi:DNA-binding response OmpR family regulator
VAKDTYRILVADDDPPILELLGEYLATRGHDVHLVSDGEMALNALQADDFDLLLTDLKMPGQDGLSLLRHIQENNLPVATILMTGYGTIESALSAMKSGAHNYLLKPFRLREVHEAVVQAVAARHQEKSTLRLSYFSELQKADANLEGPNDLMALYAQLAHRVAQELKADGALLAFFEPVEQQWVEYARSGAPSAFRGVDLDTLAEQAQRQTQPLRDPQCWFTAPKHCLVVPIRLKLAPGPAHTVGFLAASECNNTSSNAEGILYAYSHLLAQCLSREILMDRLRDTPLLSEKHPQNVDSKDTESLLAGLSTSLNPSQIKAVVWAVRLRGNGGFYLRDLIDGGQLDVATMGGGGLPIHTLSELTPILKALNERADGHGSPSGHTAKDLSPEARIARALAYWQWLCASRAYAPRLAPEAAITALKQASGSILGNQEAQLFIDFLGTKS